jgi:hypothetical protein
MRSMSIMRESLQERISARCTALHTILSTPKPEVGSNSLRGTVSLVEVTSFVSCWERKLGGRGGWDTIACRCGGIGGSTEGSFHTRSGRGVS